MDFEISDQPQKFEKTDIGEPIAMPDLEEGIELDDTGTNESLVN